MRTQQLLALSGLLLASNVAIASKLDHDDVPNRCWEACGSVVNTAQRCDHQHDNDDSAEIQCICDWDVAKTQVPLCAACIDKYDHDYDTDHDDDDDDDDDDDNDDNEALEIVRSCNFSTTTYNASAATSAGSTTTTGSVAAATTTGTSSTTGSTGSSASASASSSGGSDSGSAGASAAGTDTSSSSDPTQDSASATPTNAAAGMDAPGAISMVALAGLMPLAWL